MHQPACPDPSTLKELALALLAEQSALTLATTRGGVPWAAPVYYVSRGFDCYFFSSPDARHIKEADDNRKVSAAVFAPAATWRGIKGLQMTGGIRRQAPSLAAAQVVKRYVGKFAFTKEFFKPGQAIDLDLLHRRFKVHLYRFQPEKAYYLDNSIRFGFRRRVSL